MWFSYLVSGVLSICQTMRFSDGPLLRRNGAVCYERALQVQGLGQQNSPGLSNSKSVYDSFSTTRRTLSNDRLVPGDSLPLTPFSIFLNLLPAFLRGICQGSYCLLLWMGENHHKGISELTGTNTTSQRKRKVQSNMNEQHPRFCRCLTNVTLRQPFSSTTYFGLFGSRLNLRSFYLYHPQFCICIYYQQITFFILILNLIAL